MDNYFFVSAFLNKTEVKIIRILFSGEMFCINRNNLKWWVSTFLQRSYHKVIQLQKEAAANASIIIASHIDDEQENISLG